MKGWLLKKKSSFLASRRRFFVLRAHHLVYFSECSSLGDGLDMKGAIALTNRSVLSHSDTELTIVNPDKSWVLSGDNISEWADEIQEAIDTFASMPASYEPLELSFAVQILLGEEKSLINSKCEITVHREHMELVVPSSGRRLVWEYKGLRKFGHEKDFFSMEGGRKCTAGPGTWTLSASRAAELFRAVDYYCKEMKGTKPVSHSGGAYVELDLDPKSAKAIKPPPKVKASPYAEIDFDAIQPPSNTL